jgi:hypothetical protein
MDITTMVFQLVGFQSFAAVKTEHCVMLASSNKNIKIHRIP